MTGYWEAGRELAVLGQYDVVVCGGGPAGCAAALSSGRGGARTIVIEREGYLGGAPCTQNVVPILSTNGIDLQGVWHEWAHALARYDGSTPLHWEARCGTQWLAGSVDPEAVKVVWEELLAGAGVDVLYLAHLSGAIVKDGAASGVVVETRRGREAVLAERVVDCTGDGHVCADAGVPFASGVDGAPWSMGVSLNGWYGNVPSAEDYLPGCGNPVGGTGRSIGNLPLFQAGLQRHLRIDPLDPWDLSKVMREGRAQAWQRLAAKRKEPGCAEVYLAGTAALPGVRSSRRIEGMVTVTKEDAFELTRREDGIARSSWEIDIHPATTAEGKAVRYDDPAYQPRVRRTEAGAWFDIPYGALVAKGVDNLLMAGRCISAEHEAQSSLRIQQTCMATGQAAGVAAALSLTGNTTPEALAPAEVVKELAEARGRISPFPLPERP